MIKGSSRDKRLLEATKAPRTKVGVGLPNKAEGNDGDFQVRQINDKIKLFVKYKGIWHGVNIGKSFDKVEKKAEEASVSQNIPSNRNQILAKKLILRDIGGDIVKPDSGYGGVYVKNDKLYFINDSGGAGQIGGAATLNGLSDVTYDGAVLTISGLDEIVAAGDFTLDAVGDISLDADGGEIYFKDGGTTFGKVSTAGSFSALTLYEDGGASADDSFFIRTGVHGATDIRTVDSSGSAGAHLTLDPSGDLIVSGADVKMDAGKKLYLDDGDDTYMFEHSANYLRLVVGGAILMDWDENGLDGGQVMFRASSAGFSQLEETYSGDDILPDLGGTDDTQIDFRHTNKIWLQVIGNITNMKLIFPSMAGNFQLLLTYDGDHDITNWKAYEYDESAATTADVLWPGGTKLATTASGTDIVSLYWDNINQKCYGVASLAFATP